MNTRKAVIGQITIIDKPHQHREWIIANHFWSGYGRLKNEVNDITSKCTDRVHGYGAIIGSSILKEKVNDTNINIEDPDAVRNREIFNKRNRLIDRSC